MEHMKANESKLYKISNGTKKLTNMPFNNRE